MLTSLIIRNFKRFEEVEIELGQRVVLIGPNNSGKSTVLQALALWEMGLRRWLEKRGSGPASKGRPGVTLNRRDILAIPVPSAKLLWRDLRVREGVRQAGKQRTANVLVEILVGGVGGGAGWSCGFEFDYANEEAFYCRTVRTGGGGRQQIPDAARDLKLAYLPPMSGLAAVEDRLDPGAVNVRLGEGRTAEVLRNLCYLVRQAPGGEEAWRRISSRMGELFGIRLDEPNYLPERGQIVMSYRDQRNVRLDWSASGRGLQQTLLLLAHMAANPGSVLLLDEPDAHLEVLRQRQIYQILSKTAEETGAQIIAASHSEVLLNEAAGRDIVVAFVGRPHRIDNRGSQVLKALCEIGYEQYYLAEQTGWVLYLEGSTDLAILREFAELLDHPARSLLERPFVHYVGNQPKTAQQHFYGLREAKADLAGLAIYDRLAQAAPGDPNLMHVAWKRREIECYLCQRATLLAYAEHLGRKQQGDLFAAAWREEMDMAIQEIERALATLGKPSPWEGDLKVSDEFLNPLFEKFFAALRIENLMRKTDYCELVRFVRQQDVDEEVVEVLDQIVDTAQLARPAGD